MAWRARMDELNHARAWCQQKTNSYQYQGSPVWAALGRRKKKKIPPAYMKHKIILLIDGGTIASFGITWPLHHTPLSPSFG